MTKKGTMFLEIKKVSRAQYLKIMDRVALLALVHRVKYHGRFVPDKIAKQKVKKQ